MWNSELWSYLDTVDWKSILGDKDVYGLSDSWTLYAWIPAAFLFLFQGLSESALPFWCRPRIYFWFEKISLPILALIVHDWIVPDSTFSGLGLIPHNRLWAILIYVFSQYLHFNLFEAEYEERRFFSNMNLVLAYLRDQTPKNDVGKTHKYSVDEIN